MLPIGKMLMLPVRVEGCFEDERGLKYYRIQLAQGSILIVGNRALENTIDERGRRAAEAGEVHPNGWPT